MARQRRSFSTEFNREAAGLVVDQLAPVLQGRDDGFAIMIGDTSLTTETRLPSMPVENGGLSDNVDQCRL